MQEKQRLLQIRQVGFRVRFREVFQKQTGDGHRATDEGEGVIAVLIHFADGVGELEYGVRGVERGANGGDGLDLFHPLAGVKCCGAAEGVAHEECRCLVVFLEPLVHGEEVFAV